MHVRFPKLYQIFWESCSNALKFLRNALETEWQTNQFQQLYCVVPFHALALSSGNHYYSFPYFRRPTPIWLGCLHIWWASFATFQDLKFGIIQNFSNKTANIFNDKSSSTSPIIINNKPSMVTFYDCKRQEEKL